jgi:putative tricarboxylic transport membrane protein
LKRLKRPLFALLTVSLVLAACGVDDQPTDDPEAAADTDDTDDADDADDNDTDDFVYPDPDETLTFTVAFAPGGGNDIMSRLLADLLQETGRWPGNIVVENVEGGSGARGWGSIHRQTGNPYAISTTSGSFTATPLQADTGWEPTEFTPLALLATDEVVLFVPGDSEIDTLEEFLAAAEDDPPVIAGVGAAQLDFLAPTAVFSQAGLDMEYVSHDGTPEATSTLLSGSADALVRAPGTVFGLVESGDLKPLAISGSSRIDQLPDVPTFEESGFEIDVTFIRGLVMPPDVHPRVLEWWYATRAAIKAHQQ